MNATVIIAFAGAAALGALFVPAMAGPVRAAPVMQVLPEASGALVDKAGCRWISGWNGPVWVCRPSFGHYDWHPGHWDRHYDHYDWHPSHWDYHQGPHFH